MLVILFFGRKIFKSERDIVFRFFLRGDVESVLVNIVERNPQFHKRFNFIGTPKKFPKSVLNAGCYNYLTNQYDDSNCSFKTPDGSSPINEVALYTGNIEAGIKRLLDIKKYQKRSSLTKGVSSSGPAPDFPITKVSLDEYIGFCLRHINHVKYIFSHEVSQRNKIVSTKIVNGKKKNKNISIFNTTNINNLRKIETAFGDKKYVIPIVDNFNINDLLYYLDCGFKIIGLRSSNHKIQNRYNLFDHFVSLIKRNDADVFLLNTKVEDVDVLLNLPIRFSDFRLIQYDFKTDNRIDNNNKIFFWDEDSLDLNKTITFNKVDEFNKFIRYKNLCINVDENHLKNNYDFQEVEYDRTFYCTALRNIEYLSLLMDIIDKRHKLLGYKYKNLWPRNLKLKPKILPPVISHNYETNQEIFQKRRKEEAEKNNSKLKVIPVDE